MITPPTSITSPQKNGKVGAEKLKRKASTGLDVEGSASPLLKGSRASVNKMQRTPQPVLTQTKLTGFGVSGSANSSGAVQSVQSSVPAGGAGTPLPAGSAENTHLATDMDTDSV